MSKRISAFILSVILCILSFGPAISALDGIQNFTVESTTASWDEFPGAYAYDYSIGSGGGYITETRIDFYEECRLFNFETGTYHFAITAVNENHEPISGTVRGTFDYVSTAERLAVPTGLAWDGIKCVWNKVENASTYYLNLKDGSGSMIISKIVYGDACSYRFSAVEFKEGESYTFSVSAGRDGYLESESAVSGAKTMTAEDLVLLPAPDVKIDENGYAVWDAIPGVYGYSISYNDKMSGGNTTDTFTDFRYDISISGSESGVNRIAVFAIDENAQRLSEIWEYDYDYVKCDYYSVYFNLNGMNAQFGTGVFVVFQGSSAERPDDPFTEPFEFLGWYTDAECTSEYDFSSPVNADITLYAKWEEKTEVSEEISEEPEVSEASEVEESDAEESSEDISVETSEEPSEGISEEITAEVSEEITAEESEEVSEETSEETSSERSEEISEEASKETSAEDPAEKDEGTVHTWVWMVIAVIGAAAVSGLTVFFIMKKRK